MFKELRKHLKPRLAKALILICFDESSVVLIYSRISLISAFYLRCLNSSFASVIFNFLSFPVSRCLRSIGQWAGPAEATPPLVQMDVQGASERSQISANIRFSRCSGAQFISGSQVSFPSAYQTGAPPRLRRRRRGRHYPESNESRTQERA